MSNNVKQCFFRENGVRCGVAAIGDAFLCADHEGARCQPSPHDRAMAALSGISAHSTQNQIVFPVDIVQIILEFSPGVPESLLISSAGKHQPAKLVCLAMFDWDPFARAVISALHGSFQKPSYRPSPPFQLKLRGANYMAPFYGKPYEETLGETFAGKFDPKQFRLERIYVEIEDLHASARSLIKVYDDRSPLHVPANTVWCWKGTRLLLVDSQLSDRTPLLEAEQWTDGQPDKLAFTFIGELSKIPQHEECAAPAAAAAVVSQMHDVPAGAAASASRSAAATSAASSSSAAASMEIDSIEQPNRMDVQRRAIAELTSLRFGPKLAGQSIVFQDGWIVRIGSVGVDVDASTLASAPRLGESIEALLRGGVWTWNIPAEGRTITTLKLLHQECEEKRRAAQLSALQVYTQNLGVRNLFRQLCGAALAEYCVLVCCGVVLEVGTLGDCNEGYHALGDVSEILFALGRCLPIDEDAVARQAAQDTLLQPIDPTYRQQLQAVALLPGYPLAFPYADPGTIPAEPAMVSEKRFWTALVMQVVQQGLPGEDVIVTPPHVAWFLVDTGACESYANEHLLLNIGCNITQTRSTTKPHLLSILYIDPVTGALQPSECRIPLDAARLSDHNEDLCRRDAALAFANLLGKDLIRRGQLSIFRNRRTAFTPHPRQPPDHVGLA